MAIYVGITALNRSASVRVPAYEALADEVQTITVDATGGTFTVSFRGQTTGDLAFDISGANFTTALEGLFTIGPGNVVVTGGPGDAGGTTPYVVSFQGELGNENIELLTTAPGNLTGGAGTAVVAEQTAGGAGVATPTKLVPGTVTVVDVSDAATRKALNAHHAIGQWLVVATHSDLAGGDQLPDN